MGVRPPAVARALVRFLSRGEDRDFLVGDLDDRFRELARSGSLQAARRWYWRQAFIAVPWLIASHRPRFHAASWAPLSGLREAARSLTRSPIFTGVSVLSVGVGIGLGTSVFAIAHAVFFTPPPYRDAARLVQIWDTQQPGSHQRSDYVLPQRMLGWVDTPMRYVTGVSGYGMTPDEVMEGGAGPVRVGVQPIVGDWFGTLGTPALLGRVLTAADERSGAEPAAVVSWAVWMKRMGGRSDVLGHVIHLDGAAYTVVGVMPRSFTSDEEVWVPEASLSTRQSPVGYLGVARLRPGATLQQARAEIEQRAAAQVAQDSVRWGGFGATAVPIAEVKAAGSRSALWALVAVVGAVLLIGLSNLTTLFLVRAQGRSAMMAVRAALGANTWQLGRALLAEALLVALGGSALGVVFALWGTGVAASLVFGAGGAPPELGTSSVLVAIVLAVLVTAVVGLEPLRRLRDLDVQQLLQRRAAGGGSTRGERRSRDVMVGVQVAVCVVLVAMLGVFATAYRNFVAVDPGYDARRLVRAAPDWQAAGMDASAQWALARQVAERARHDPAVSDVALWHLMMGAWPPEPRYDPVVEGVPAKAPAFGGTNRVDPGFFRAIGIPLLQGRTFTDADNAASPLVAIVTKDGADAWWPGQNPLGHRIKFGRDAPWMTVIGVVPTFAPVGRVSRGNTIRGKLFFRRLPRVFVPARQWLTLPPGWRTNADCDDCEGVSIAVRASGAVRPAEEALRSALRTVAPDLPLNFLETVFDQQMNSSFEARQIIPPGRLAATGSAVGLLLALLGIVGVVADGVARRTREIGIRMALGAPSLRVLATVARESVLTGIAGLGAGLAVLIALHGVISKRIIDMQIRSLTPRLTDPALLAAVAAIVLALMMIATVLTARRALRVDPAEALRSE